jgi:beta-lactamase regulating signal transducer with metallopeptidase domain
MIEQTNHIAGIWWAWMWPMCWQVSLLIILVGTVDLAIRRHVWPQVRYALWLLVLAKLVLPPTFSLSTSITSQLQPLAEKLFKEGAVVNETPVIPLSERNLRGVEPLINMSPIVVPKKNTVGKAVAFSGEAKMANIPVLVAKEKISWHAYAMAMWLSGALILAVWLMVRFRQLRQAHHEKIDKADLPPWFGEVLNDTATKLNLKHLPEVVLSRSIACPAVFGVFKPVLLIPTINIKNHSRKRIEHIMLHELAHIKRWDLKVHTFYMILQVVYWFNPLLWLVRRQLQHLRELCCDATVARVLRDKTVDYRETILQTAKWLLTKPKMLKIGILGLVEGPSRLLVRLTWLEKKTWKHRGL